jgi:hypothetical protein
MMTGGGGIIKASVHLLLGAGWAPRERKTGGQCGEEERRRRRR